MILHCFLSLISKEQHKGWIFLDKVNQQQVFEYHYIKHKDKKSSVIKAHSYVNGQRDTLITGVFG